MKRLIYVQMYACKAGLGAVLSPPEENYEYEVNDVS